MIRKARPRAGLRRAPDGGRMGAVLNPSPPLPASLAILNGFGISLGDSIIGLQALWAAQQLGHVQAPPVLFRRPGLRPMVDLVYPLAANFCSVQPLPAALEPSSLLAQGFARVIDMRDFAFDPAFRGTAMIDFFLRKLELAPETVPAALRRNLWLASHVRPVPPSFGAGYALVCPTSSMPMRDMPPVAHGRILRWLRARGLRVVTQGPPGASARAAPVVENMPELCGLVAGAACVISTDTAMVHLADAFSVPCLAFFTTHRPEWRVRDYPHCTPVYLRPEGLPEALEFVRRPEDEAATRAAWERLGADMAWLDPVLERFVP